MKDFLKLIVGVSAGIILVAGGSIAYAVGAFPVATGGTGWTNITSGALLYGRGTSPLGTTTAGTNGQILSLSNGIPKWISTSSVVTSVTGTYPIISSGGTTPAISTAFGTTTANTFSLLNIFANATSTLFTSTTAWIGTLNLTNPLTVANGGTGAATLTGCLTGNGTGAITGSGTCNTSAASVTSITGGTGLNGGAITTAGTLSLKSYLGTSTADTANQVSVFTSTNAVPATFGGFANFTFNSATNNFVVINASTTNVSASQSLYAADSAATIRRVTGTRALSFILSTSTVWTSTSTIGSGFGDQGTVYAPFTGSFSTIQCGTNAGTLGINVQDGAGSSAFIKASTTANTNTFSLSFTKGDALKITGGNPTASPTSTPCTLVGSEN